MKIRLRENICFYSWRQPVISSFDLLIIMLMIG